MRFGFEGFGVVVKVKKKGTHLLALYCDVAKGGHAEHARDTKGHTPAPPSVALVDALMPLLESVKKPRSHTHAPGDALPTATVVAPAGHAQHWSNPAAAEKVPCAHAPHAPRRASSTAVRLEGRGRRVPAYPGAHLVKGCVMNRGIQL